MRKSEQKARSFWAFRAIIFLPKMVLLRVFGFWTYGPIQCRNQNNRVFNLGLLKSDFDT